MRTNAENVELAASRAEIARLQETVNEQAIELVMLRGTALGLVGRVPARVEPDVKLVLLSLVAQAVAGAWSRRRALRVLGLTSGGAALGPARRRR